MREFGSLVANEAAKLFAAKPGKPSAERGVRGEGQHRLAGGLVGAHARAIAQRRARVHARTRRGASGDGRSGTARANAPL